MTPRSGARAPMVWGLLVTIALAQRADPVWVVLWALVWGTFLYARQLH